ncbi:DGQHR domain-containing protein DpdB [Bradyrhizobium sp. SZCCHNR1020]|uniref:DGQHR domain-containing protein DpdB n=1 Tax=Bradyrhizobium sp. SZCCHNR1020 TaxID=3057343 RepID=UPI002915E409|nr:DGQHR domain-containing protein DpdB [Bradyrhizobium sp. SZCCHNR1020]
MSKKTVLHFDALAPVQSPKLTVFTFVANAADVARIARIERAGRDDGGILQGFQRPQIAGHIREIRDYLEKPNSILPNAIVIAFMGGARLKRATDAGDRRRELIVDISDGPPGWIVDGQQRFTALSELRGRNFEVLVSGFLCETEEELQKQFILVNNTRPLPKALVYELLPKVGDLPPRMSNRSQAALVTEALNYRKGSSLKGLIKQQTNPKGSIRDTVLQRVIMNSLSDGALRLYAGEDQMLLQHGVTMMSEFYHAVQHVFADDWIGKTPKTSRLVHGTGIIALGYVMDFLNGTTGAVSRDEFARGLQLLKGKTAWSDGEWQFGNERRRWNGLQNVPADVRQLTLYLVQVLKRGLAKSSKAA